jgi:branched-chain amino acid transport system permease protein
MSTKLRNSLILLSFSLLILAGGFALIAERVVNEYVALILTRCGIWVIVAVSLNFVTGFTGQLALGQAGFMSAGAYGCAITMMQLGFPLPLAMLSGGLVAAMFGLVVGYPTLKLSGDYLAIVTLGFGEIIKVILNNLEGLTGGPTGLKGIPSFVDPNAPPAFLQGKAYLPAMSFLIVMVTLFIVLALITALMRSSFGRAIVSVREDEIAARAMGIRTKRLKILAFAGSAFIAGIGGALYAPFYNFLQPDNFNFMVSIDFLIIVVLGGLGSVTGTVIAGFVLVSMQESLRFLSDYRMVIYPLILIVIMIFRPSGLMGRKEISIVGLFNRLRTRKGGAA